MNALAYLTLALRFAAAAQLGIAVLNLFLIRIMKWRPDLERMPLLLAQVFRIHCFFISITLAIFGVLTWRFAPDIATASTPIGTWLAAGIGLFWLARSIMQWSHYSASHWRGHLQRTVIHYVLFFGYGGFAAIYFIAAVWRPA